MDFYVDDFCIFEDEIECNGDDGIYDKGLKICWIVI